MPLHIPEGTNTLTSKGPLTMSEELLNMFGFFNWLTAKPAKRKRKKSGSGVRRSGKKGAGRKNVGCGTGAGGFAKGNSCRKGGAGTGEKPGGPVTAKARKDAAKEETSLYNPKNPTDAGRIHISGMPAKINVETGPPRNAKESALLIRAEKAGKDAIVRTSKRSATTHKDGSQKHFDHGEERIATVLPTRDVATVKPAMGDRPYDPADHARTKTSKFTVIDHRGLISGHPSLAKAESVARSRVKGARKELEGEHEFKMVKDHKTSNIVQGSEFGWERKSVMTIRVLKGDGPVEDLVDKSVLFDEAKCKRRKRMAAIRDEVDAAPVRLFSSETEFPAWSAPDGWDGTLKFSAGTLPEDDASALDKINRVNAKKGLKKLTKKDVYVHYMEAANSSFIGDRFMFLSESTLRNIAKHADAGFAFMNSHRTGGVSAPTELPFGRTFSGRYEEYERGGETLKRAMIGVYMLRGQYPNGVGAGPSTDDLHAGINGGTISDVSMGLVGGERICDVCGTDLGLKDESGEFLCPHAPGTDRLLSKDQKSAQKARGVKAGFASYTLVDSVPQEVSAVYKGAVAGAGFRKALSLSRTKGFSARHGSDVFEAFGPLMNDRQIKTFKGVKEMSRMSLLKAFRFWQAAGEPEEIDIDDIRDIPEGAAPPARESVRDRSQSDPAETALSEADTERQNLLDKREREIDARAFSGDASLHFKPLILESKLTPYEADQLSPLMVLLAFDDKERPAIHPVTGKPVKRVDLLKLGNSQRSSTGLLSGDQVGGEPLVKAGETALDNESGKVDALAEARKRDMGLLALTPLGREILASEYGAEGKSFLASLKN